MTRILSSLMNWICNLILSSIISDILEPTTFAYNSQLQLSMSIISLIQETRSIKVAALNEKQQKPSDEKSIGEIMCHHLQAK